jgi:hypothetical protein
MSSIYSSQTVVLNNVLTDKLLACLTGTLTAGVCATATVGLFNSSGIAPMPSDALAVYTAATPTFSGYATKTFVPSGAVNLSNSCQGVIGNVTFTQATSTAPLGDTVYGYFVQSGANLLWAERFASGAALPLVNAGDFVELNVALPLQSVQKTS